MAVVVVESPAKAKTINKYLGSGYTVLASYGHVRDLPPKDGSVKPDEDFAMEWEVDAKAQKHIRAIADAVKDDDKLILATDPDREGEAISWHLLEALRKRRVLKKDTPVERVVFNAITKSAVTEAMANPREIDQPLVDAYLARRALDYLVGFTLSPVLWRKLPGSRSAGRVQSVTLRLVVEREMEIEKFKAQEFWTVVVRFATPRGDEFEARLTLLDGQKLDKFSLGEKGAADAAVAAIESRNFSVASVEAKPGTRNPFPPFTTSTLQQEASRKLGMSPAQTMRTAQRLYEGVEIGGETVGLITYMRTDGVDMAPEAVTAAREVIKSRFGEAYVPGSPRMYKSKQKNAQEAHECIRPTDMARHPDQLKGLEPEMRKLYDLIWKRSIACQMESARLERTTVDILSGDKTTGLRATGQVVKFDGFLKLYQEGRDDEEDEESRRLPEIVERDALDRRKTIPEQHFTQPPPRYTEATLVKKMEELGIGRPSTYASIVSVIQDRDYVRKEKNRLYPEDKGRLVTAFLENFFKRYVEYGFTADLEDSLDEVSGGREEWRELLRRFWDPFNNTCEETKKLRNAEVIDKINEALEDHIFPEREDGKPARLCPLCNEGQLSLKPGKFGAFIGCSNYPECRYTRQLGGEEGAAEAANPEGKLLGQDPETGQDVTLRSGRFGIYLQLGEPEGKEKPKRSSIPKGVDPDGVDLDFALKLLSLPRLVGKHPDDGESIEAGLGRFGPFVKHGSTYANLKEAAEVFEIGVNRAVVLLAEKREKGGGGRGAAAKPLREIGKHPSDGEAINLFAGRYGPYVKHGKTNATIPKGADPEKLTLEEAVKLIDEKASKGGKKKAAPKKKAAKKASDAEA